MKVAWFWGLLYFMAVHVACAAPEKSTCAVLPLEAGDGITAGEAQTISEGFFALLHNARQLVIVDRDKSEQIYKEIQNRQRDDFSSDKYAIEIGKFLVAQKIIYGRVSKFGHKYTLHSRLVDVETKQVESEAFSQCDDQKEAILTELLPANVNALLALQPGPQKNSIATGPQTKSVDIGKGVSIELVWIEPLKLWFGKTEVTKAQYQAFLDDSGYEGRSDADRGYLKHLRGKDETPSGEAYPIVWISWGNAAAFCDWASRKTGQHFRLPSEGEWETACRGNSSGDYFFEAGKGQLDDYAWYDKNSGNLHLVGSKKPNAFGLYDIAGNVWEFCSDWFDSDQISRTLRGGSWRSPASMLTVKYRQAFKPKNTWDNVGFRLVQSP